MIYFNKVGAPAPPFNFDDFMCPFCGCEDTTHDKENRRIFTCGYSAECKYSPMYGTFTSTFCHRTSGDIAEAELDTLLNYIFS